MILGIVNDDLEATVRLVVCGTEGQDHAVETEGHGRVGLLGVGISMLITLSTPEFSIHANSIPDSSLLSRRCQRSLSGAPA